MEIRRVPYSEVVRIVEKVSADRYDGNIVVHADAKPLGNSGFRGRIIGQTSNGPGTRRSWSGRRGPYACWHAYRDVLREIFKEYPNATVRTSMARYDGAAGFEREYPGTADKNIGSMFQPAYMPDLCECYG